MRVDPKREAALYDYYVENGAYFVFGSNEAGVHGAGAARAAYDKYGAVWGQGWGVFGSSFAFPTKDHNIVKLPLASVKRYAESFKEIARLNPSATFAVTRLGCGLAGFRESDIAPLFADAPSNCILPEGWAGGGTWENTEAGRAALAEGRVPPV